ncbi:hypothetical protein Tco_0799718 [Tanacetum coccineum]|uniref:Integrase, catalytic region, zinc finger, CCHC-type, peptidase aspartic, catalytic n=1 Tax=Tanacetum coccineum TaxID=301880 RepID=A0ABQ4ZS47_9ASTR
MRSEDFHNDGSVCVGLSLKMYRAGYGGAFTELGMLIRSMQGMIKSTTATVKAHKAGTALQPKHRGQDHDIDKDVDEQHVQDLALNVDNVFQADDSDAFDSDVDEAPMTQTMFMANLSSADPIYDEAVPSYDSRHSILSNVSSVPNDAYMMIYKDMYEPHAQSVSKTTRNTVVDNSLTAELATYKEQVELYERRARFELMEREQKIDE